MRTKVKLVQDLQFCGAPKDMITKAIDGYYDDYESPLAGPIIQLVADCEKLGGNLISIAVNAKKGEYDGTSEESEAWFNKEGKGIMEELLNEY